MAKPSATDDRLLAAFRYEIRKFLAFSEQAARASGIEPQQHQLLLALRGLPEGARPTIKTVAERLCVQHHTAVALVDKLEQRGYLRRERNRADRREVLLSLTPDGEGSCASCPPHTVSNWPSPGRPWSQPCKRSSSRKGRPAPGQPLHTACS